MMLTVPLLLAIALQAPQAPARDTSAKAGTAVLRGHISAADTGQPLRKVLVRVFAAELRENRTTTTDADGRYEFKDLPAGRYNINASKGGYVTLTYGQTRPFEPGKPLDVKDGETIEKVDFALPRGAVITGRVLDEYGDSVSDVQVVTLRYQFIQGRRQLSPAGGHSSLTNDLGEFRVYGLTPGQYYLSATLRPFAMAVGESDDRSGYAPTYYPGTSNVAEAQRITVGIGQTVNDMNFVLVPVHTAKISGTALDADGKPMAGGFVNGIQRVGFMFTSAAGTQIKPDGTFVVNGLAPGEYTLQASAPGSFGDAARFATTQVTVAGEDVTGIALTAVRPSTITGRVVLPPALASTLRPGTIRFTVVSMNREPLFTPGMPQPTINDDLTFELKARPGPTNLRPVALTGDWTLKAVRVNGIDVTDTGFDVRPGEDLSGVEIELTNTPTQVTGTVSNDRGEPATDYVVVLFPQDREQWDVPMSRRLVTARPDQDGTFKARLAPGDYYAIAVETIEPGDGSDPEFLDRVRDRATTVTVGEGETKVITLKMTGGI